VIPHGEVPPGLVRPVLRRVLAAAARLQQVVPDAVLLGGSAAALWANHRESLDDDHVVADLSERFDTVLDAIEATDGWVTNRVAPGKLVLGGIETGVRQLIRRRPLEVIDVDLGDVGYVRVPTPDETLRIKGYLIVRRNQTRDYLDVVALADRYGIEHASQVLAHLDDYYGDQRPPEVHGVATQLVRQLSDPRPKDSRTTMQLATYKGLEVKWREWSQVVEACRQLAVAIVRAA